MFPNVNLAKATGVMFPNVNITMRLKWISQNKNVQPKQNVPPQTGRHAIFYQTTRWSKAAKAAGPGGVS